MYFFFNTLWGTIKNMMYFAMYSTWGYEGVCTLMVPNCFHCVVACKTFHIFQRTITLRLGAKRISHSKCVTSKMNAAFAMVKLSNQVGHVVSNYCFSWVWNSMLMFSWVSVVVWSCILLSYKYFCISFHISLISVREYTKKSNDIHDELASWSWKCS